MASQTSCVGPVSVRRRYSLAHVRATPVDAARRISTLMLTPSALVPLYYSHVTEPLAGYAQMVYAFR